jgi:D-glycero-alpha-D-manno-heptose-7-phosphate kinase
VLDNLEDGLCLFFTGYTRSASGILKDQDDKSKAKDGSVIDNLHHIKDLGRRSHAALLQGDLAHFAELMDEHWQQKKKRSGDMSNSRIDEWYESAMRNGALGGKLIGAGGGGSSCSTLRTRDDCCVRCLNRGSKRYASASISRALKR